jgi:hypothetical protein
MVLAEWMKESQKIRKWEAQKVSHWVDLRVSDRRTYLLGLLGERLTGKSYVRATGSQSVVQTVGLGKTSETKTLVARTLGAIFGLRSDVVASPRVGWTGRSIDLECDRTAAAARSKLQAGSKSSSRFSDLLNKVSRFSVGNQGEIKLR